MSSLWNLAENYFDWSAFALGFRISSAKALTCEAADILTAAGCEKTVPSSSYTSRENVTVTLLDVVLAANSNLDNATGDAACLGRKTAAAIGHLRSAIQRIGPDFEPALIALQCALDWLEGRKDKEIPIPRLPTHRKVPTIPSSEE